MIQLQLFDFIKILFERPLEYEKLSNYEKAKFFFLTNRFCAIQYPVQANALNHIKIPKESVLDYWQVSLNKIYKKTPDWIYAKGQKAAGKTSKKKLPSSEAIKFYLDKNKLSRKQLDEAFKMFGEAAYEPIRKIEKLMDIKND